MMEPSPDMAAVGGACLVVIDGSLGMRSVSRRYSSVADLGVKLWARLRWMLCYVVMFRWRRRSKRRRERACLERGRNR